MSRPPGLGHQCPWVLPVDTHPRLVYTLAVECGLSCLYSTAKGGSWGTTSCRFLCVFQEPLVRQPLDILQVCYGRNGSVVDVAFPHLPLTGSKMYDVDFSAERSSKK